MTVKTKRIYDPVGEGDGLRILVSRFYPRGVKRTHFDRWMRELSPTTKLLFDYREKKITWNTFSKRLVQELSGNPDSTKAIKELHDLARTHELTLLCYEKEGDNCHRNIVRELIEHPGKLRKRKPKTD